MVDNNCFIDCSDMGDNNTSNYFKHLNSIDCSDKVEGKNGLTYLSWAWAWAELKKRYPDSTYTVYENADGWNYHTDGKTAWVKTGVTVCGIEHVEMLPVMDHRNKSIPLASITSFDVNKAIQRSLTKAVARHGLGLYIYAGEDLPEDAGKPVTKDQAAELERLVKEARVKPESVWKAYGARKVSEMRTADYKAAKARLLERIGDAVTMVDPEVEAKLP